MSVTATNNVSSTPTSEGSRIKSETPKKVIYKCDIVNGIKFKDKNMNPTPPERLALYKKIANFIRNMSPYRIECDTVVISTEVKGGQYLLNRHAVLISPQLLDVWELVLGHELMHGMFDVNYYIDEVNCLQSSDQELQSIYIYSLMTGADKLIKDSVYYDKPGFDWVGHPYDNPSEMFASASSAFIFNKDKMIELIEDPATPKETRQCCYEIFRFLRDKAYGGVFKNGEFNGKGSDLCNLYDKSLPPRTEPFTLPDKKHVIKSLMNVAKESNKASIRIAAIYQILYRYEHYDPRMKDLLIKAWVMRVDGDNNIRRGAALNMVESVKLMKKYDPQLRDKQLRNILREIVAVEELSSDLADRHATPLIKALDEIK
jgi:hypothetical protein